MRPVVFVVLVGLIPLVSADASAKRTSIEDADFRPSLCTPPETELATCHVGRKLASVCGVRPGKAVYRFGRAGHLELEAAGLRHAHEMYSGGGETQVYFKRGAYTYILYDLMTRTNFGPGPNDPSFTRRLVLLRNHRFEVISHCPKVDPAILSNLVPEYMPEGPFIEHYELKVDPAGQ